MDTLTITLTREDLMQVEMIDLDRDELAALMFIRERLRPEIQRRKRLKMRGHLDGGKGSAY